MRASHWLLLLGLAVVLLMLWLQSLDSPPHHPATAPARTVRNSPTGERPPPATPAALPPAITAPAQADTGAAQSLHVYRWQDKDGEWHVSNVPPPGTSDYEVRDYGD